MKAGVVIGQAEHHAKLVDTLVLARYTLRMFDGTTVCGQRTPWKIECGPEVGGLTMRCCKCRAST
ncbi:hypothetical protein J8I87_00830 [Paraburkholderia sp. LEh10]|uniref:hypothetical protein n=1 Tax=Paraburkholderia sp. LEh10 TaxID=2821353 RepID=UPI001AE4E594|nr:hypothetical protein [Paraburkholderia sp. LEh10]MBP0588287.1 hypothetical protein [Paraburkholderia sp. LEh10]